MGVFEVLGVVDEVEDLSRVLAEVLTELSGLGVEPGSDCSDLVERFLVVIGVAEVAILRRGRRPVAVDRGAAEETVDDVGCGEFVS